MSTDIASKVWDYSHDDLNLVQKAVLVRLAFYASHTGEDIYPSRETLAQQTSASMSTVTRTLRYLKENEFLVPVSSKIGKVVKYKINLEKLHVPSFERKLPAHLREPVDTILEDCLSMAAVSSHASTHKYNPSKPRVTQTLTGQEPGSQRPTCTKNQGQRDPREGHRDPGVGQRDPLNTIKGYLKTTTGGQVVVDENKLEDIDVQPSNQLPSEPIEAGDRETEEITLLWRQLNLPASRQLDYQVTFPGGKLLEKLRLLRGSPNIRSPLAWLTRALRDNFESPLGNVSIKPEPNRQSPWSPELQARENAHAEALSDPNDWRDVMLREHMEMMKAKRLAEIASLEAEGKTSS